MLVKYQYLHTILVERGGHTMANSKQATKRVRQNIANAEANNVHVAKMRTAIKAFEAAVNEQADDVQDKFNNAVREIDRCATRGLIHNNKANRTKTRLAAKMK